MDSTIDQSEHSIDVGYAWNELYIVLQVVGLTKQLNRQNKVSSTLHIATNYPVIEIQNIANLVNMAPSIKYNIKYDW